MQVTRIICPRCGVEVRDKQDVSDLNSYDETIVYERCAKCKKLPKTPEDRLLDAIFGEPVDPRLPAYEPIALDEDNGSVDRRG